MSAHRWDRCHPLIGQKAPMIRRHVARPNRGPFLKRSAHLTWSKVSGLAHGKPSNGIYAYSSFYDPVTHSPLGPSRNRPNNIMWAIEYNTSPFHFQPMYGPRRLSAHMRPSYLSALYRPTVTLAHNEQFTRVVSSPC